MPNIALELGKQSTSFGVTAAYGEQQDVDGVRIVPVALTWAGFGGGSDEQGNGGGGGGGYTLPLGAYIRRGDDLRFDPNIVSLLGTQRNGNKLNILMEYVPGKVRKKCMPHTAGQPMGVGRLSDPPPPDPPLTRFCLLTSFSFLFLFFLSFSPLSQSLDSLLEKFGGFSEKVIRSYTKQLLEALSYCHANRVVHRDIKGKNILCNSNGVIKLADFGSAKRFTNVMSKDAPSLSYNYTPLWTAPEVLVGDYNSKVDSQENRGHTLARTLACAHAKLAAQQRCRATEQTDQRLVIGLVQFG